MTFSSSRKYRIKRKACAFRGEGRLFLSEPASPGTASQRRETRRRCRCKAARALVPEAHAANIGLFCALGRPADGVGEVSSAVRVDEALVLK